MKKTILITLVLFSTRAFAQDKSTTVELKGRGYFERCMDLGDAGIVFQESWAKVVNKHPGAIHYYSATGDLIWRKPITNVPGKTFMTASPDGSFIYSVDLKGSASVTQIKPDGSSIEKDLPDSKTFLKNLTTVFCDRSYLYYLSTLNGDQFSDKKRGTEKLVVHRFSHTDFAYKQFTLDLPAIASDKNTSFWAFLGQKNDQKFVLSKEVNPQTGSVRFSVVSFNPDGQITKKINISDTFTAGQQLVEPTDYTDRSKGVAVILDMDNQLLGTFTMPGLAHDMTGGTTVGSYARTNGIYASAYFDPANEHLYMITISKPGSSKTITNVTFQILRYNLNGDMQWKSSFQHPEGATFATHILPNGNTNLTAYGKSGVIGYELSSKDGKVLQTQNIEYNDGYSHEVNSNWKWRLIKISENGKVLPSAQYITNLSADDRKSGTFGSFVSSKGELVVVTPKRGDTKLLYFKR